MLTTIDRSIPMRTPEAPLLRNRTDVQIYGAYSKPYYSAGAAYALTDRVGILGRAWYASKPDGRNGSLTTGELGIGLFNRTKGNGIYELYGGAGWGTSSFNGNNYYEFGGQRTLASSNHELLNYWNLWLQVDAGVRWKLGSLAVIIRGNDERVYHDEYSTNVYYEIDPGFFGDPNPPYSRTGTSSWDRFYITPGVQGRLGYEHFYLEGTVSLLEPSTEAPVLSSIGLMLRF